MERTGGALTGPEWRRLLLPVLRDGVETLAGRARLALGRRASTTPEIALPPRSALVEAAEEAAATQPAPLLGHANRTWAFGRALAAVDGETGLDDELFYVAALLHDTGLVEAVVGEDFTRRSADTAGPLVERHCGADAGEVVRDAIAAHATPGATVADDGPLAFYLQAGAVCDLVGLRLHRLDADFVEDWGRRHARDGLRDDIRGRISAEAAAVPEGRFALLRWTGIGLAIRLSPLPS